MKKTAEQEVQLKLAIRDVIARNPLVSGHQLCRDLAAKGFRTANGNPLAWYYVAKLAPRIKNGTVLFP